MEQLPKDPVILMGFINMKLRDFYPSLDELCADMQIDRSELISNLAQGGFEYNSAANKFW